MRRLALGEIDYGVKLTQMDACVPGVATIIKETD
jgi:hypothetical protein